MSTPFRQRIRKSIADGNLQIALDNNARRRRDGRLTAFAAVPDHQERRRRAHAVKANVVSNLDRFLDQFIRSVEKNGIIVHRAADAVQANAIILDILSKIKRADGKPILVAKAKSMVSEEINLNHVLEGHGIRAVETDLGEYIVQLRGERPSHIITPAVHLRRGDVGKLFEEKLGLPYTEEIPVLTDTAHKVLREVFLSADAGVSGVNFGVAETGTLCLVTNEGNGRMCTTMPPVHIALMGMERLVPTLDDLALFLSLLPRSATGQKLSVYTSLINSPLPGQTRHLILLDNGRSSLRESPLAESLYCIRCGACLNACPVFRELGGHAYGSIYPGPIGSVISGALVDPQFNYLSQASSLCGACREACPVDIDLPGMLLRIRAGEGAATIPSARKSGQGLPALVKFGVGMYHWAASMPRLFTFAQRLLGLLPLPAFIRLPAWTGWGLSKDFPRPARRSFHARWKSLQNAAAQEFVSAGSAPTPAPDTTPAPASTLTESLADRFTREVTALGGSVTRVQRNELPARLTAFLQERGGGRVLTDETCASLLTGMTAVTEADPSVNLGVTGAVCGIAESGSLLVSSGAGISLQASLLPGVHAAVLEACSLVATLPEALCLPQVSRSEASVLISGPSRTADIEMTLTIGVHGPGELRVFLVDDSTGG